MPSIDKNSKYKVDDEGIERESGLVHSYLDGTSCTVCRSVLVTNRAKKKGTLIHS